jgi:hypothetical protein
MQFLAAYGKLGNVALAAEIAKIDRRTHYDWLKNDPAYAEAFRGAVEQAGDLLEAEARRRAVEGTERPIYQGGKRVGTVREYSDALLIFLLKGTRPQKFRENYKIEYTGAVRVQYDERRRQVAEAIARRYNKTVEEVLADLAAAPARPGKFVN